jgi:hypothetical protein
MEMFLLHEFAYVNVPQLSYIGKKRGGRSLPCPWCTCDKNIWFLPAGYHSVFNVSFFTLILKHKDEMEKFLKCSLLEY